MSLFTKVYPTEKFKTEIYSPMVIIYRLASIPLLLISKILNLHPNFITLISFFTLFAASIYAFYGSFIIASLLMFLTIVLDCVDGELARLNEKNTVLGVKLESIHADLTLILFPGTILIGLIKMESFSNWILLLLLFSTAIYVNWRSIYSSSPIKDDPSKLSFINKIIYSQQKPNNEIRDSSIIGKAIFITRINTATQLGVSFALITIFSFIDSALIIYPIWIIIISQLIFGIAVVIGKILFSNLK